VSGVRSFRDLLVYQTSRDVSRLARQYARLLPSDERFALSSQLRRAADSVVLNIAEGYGIGTTQATLRHLRIARGSLCEVRAALDIAQDAQFAPVPTELLDFLDHTARLLHGLIKSLNKPPTTPE
jgi:four helix bundle protein